MTPPSTPLSRRGPFVGATLALMALAGGLRVFAAQFKFRNGGDCVRYLTWSHRVAAEGMAAFPRLVDEWQHKWVGFPPPTRWTYLALLALLERIWQHPADEYHPIVIVSYVAGVVALVPLGLWLKRIATPEVAVLGMLLLAISPLCIGMSKYPLPDEWQLLNTIVIIWLTSDWLAEPRRWKLGGIAIVSFLLVTIRETGLLSIIAAGLLMLVDRKRHGRLRLPPFWAMLAGCVVATVVTLFIAGGLHAFTTLVATYVPGSLVSTGNKGFVSGPYYRYLVDFLIVAPAVVVTAIAAIGPLLRRADLRPATVEVVVVTVALLALNSALTKTLRYVMAVEVGMRAVCAMAVWALWTRDRNEHKWTRWQAAALLAILVAHDVVLWWSLWKNDQVYDPTTYSIARQLGFTP